MPANAWLVAPSSLCPLIIGHRGASAEAPENTLRAFQLAQTQGADGIECDLWLSADGQPVIVHDARLDRTTNASGLVSAYTVSQLQRMDAGQGEPIPTLNQLFETLGRGFLYNLEIKVYGWLDRGLEAAIATAIQAHGLAAQVLISSFDPRALWRARRWMPAGVLLGLLYEDHTAYGRYVFGGQAIHPPAHLTTPALMAQAQRRRWRVHVWTVDDPNQAQYLHTLGVHAIITNRPALLRQHFGV